MMFSLGKIVAKSCRNIIPFVLHFTKEHFTMKRTLLCLLSALLLIV